ncbi:MAG: hypothetical protein ACHREM_19315 [Polyangiales bacterium]
MTLPTKHARSITVDGLDLRYVVSDPDVPYHLDITVQAASGDGQKLRARVAYESVPAGGGAQTQVSMVTPAYVVRVVRTALTAGWRPGDRGPDFRLD